MSKIRIVIFVAILIGLGYFGYNSFIAKPAAPQYQTAQATKGSLINSVSATGIIATLDIDAQIKQTAALSSYLSAKNSFETAKAKVNSLQAAAFKANQTFMNDAVARGLKTDDPTYIQENALWLQAESDYRNQTDVITQAQAALNSAWLSYLQLHPTNSLEQGKLQAQVNISEIDSVKVKEGDKVTMTLDAFPDATFTGKVASINTNGVISSGVASYPAIISFDTGNDHIYPNMNVTAKIITSVKNDVILVPSAAIQTSTVRIMKNGQPVSVTVAAGDSNDTQTEIVSGINEGDIVVTGMISPAGRTRAPGAASPFGARGFMR